MLKPTTIFNKYLALILCFLWLGNMELFAQENKNNSYNLKFSVRYVNSENLNLYNAPSENSEVVDVFLQLKKIVVLSKDDRLSDKNWIRVISPQSGYVKRKNLITEKELEEIRWEDKKEKEKIEFASTFSSLQIVKKEKKGGNSKYFSLDLSSEKSYVEKVVLVSPNIRWFKDSAISLWWTEKFDKNKNDYLSFATLNLRVRTTNQPKQKLYAIVSLREKNEADYSYYFTTKEFVLPDSKSRNTAKLTIGSEGKELKKGLYNIKIDIYEVETKSLFASLNRKFSALEGRKFETEDYDRSEITFEENDSEFQKLDNADVKRSLHQITALFHWGGYTVPIESEFSCTNYSFDTKKLYFGGSIEYSKSNWLFGFGLGANVMPEAINEDSTFYKTEVYYLYTSLSFSRLFEKYFDFYISKNIDFYMTAGATYWKTEFQKIKYSGVTSNYNLKMNNEGYGYLLGGGVTYSIYNIIIGVQYQLFHSGSAEFSKPVSYKSFDGKETTIIDTYDLYPGYQQIQLMLGYRLEF